MPPKPPGSQLSRRRLLGTAAMAALAGCSRQPAPAGRERLDLPLPRPNRLNVVVIATSSWRHDHFGFYGAANARTPRLDEFAAGSVVFEQSCAEALPNIPARRVWHAGRSLLLQPQPWQQPLLPTDVTLAEVFAKAGYQTGLITDNPAYFEPGMNLHQGFDSFQWIRGQETDAFIPGPLDQYDPSSHMPPYHVTDDYIRRMKQYMANTANRKGEEDYFTALVARAAMEWLEQSRRQKPFFLWVDMYDPHEPWDPPASFQQLYRNDYGFERYLFGYGIRRSDVRDTDIPIIGDLYAAETSFSDHWIGQLLDRIDLLGMRDDSVVVFLSDHGTHLGEQGCLQKTPGLLNPALIHTPLVIRHPDHNYAGRRVPAQVSALDLMPTLLTLIGIREFPGLDGSNIWRVVNGNAAAIHDRLITAYDDFAAVRDPRWHYFQNVRSSDPGHGPALYDLAADPAGAADVAAQHPDIVAQCRGWISDAMKIDLSPAG